jgi:hypothetical protein
VTGVLNVQIAARGAIKGTTSAVLRSKLNELRNARNGSSDVIQARPRGELERCRAWQEPVMDGVSVIENQSRGLDSRSFSRIEFLRLAHQHLPVSGRMILMASDPALSESLAWWARAALHVNAFGRIGF